MELNISPSFKKFLQEKKSTPREKTYYKRYDVKILRALHKQAMIKHQSHENTLARETGVCYSTGIFFEKSLVNMDKAIALTKSNKMEKHKEKAVPVRLNQTLTY